MRNSVDLLEKIASTSCNPSSNKYDCLEVEHVRENEETKEPTVKPAEAEAPVVKILKRSKAD